MINSNQNIDPTSRIIIRLSYTVPPFISIPPSQQQMRPRVAITIDNTPPFIHCSNMTRLHTQYLFTTASLSSPKPHVTISPTFRAALSTTMACLAILTLTGLSPAFLPNIAYYFDLGHVTVAWCLSYNTMDIAADARTESLLEMVRRIRGENAMDSVARRSITPYSEGSASDEYEELSNSGAERRERDLTRRGGTDGARQKLRLREKETRKDSLTRGGVP